MTLFAVLAIPVRLAAQDGEAQIQTFHVLHTFTSQKDGAEPFATLIANPVGNLFGTTSGGGNDSCPYRKLDPARKNEVSSRREANHSVCRSPIGSLAGETGHVSASLQHLYSSFLVSRTYIKEGRDFRS